MPGTCMPVLRRWRRAAALAAGALALFAPAAFAACPLPPFAGIGDGTFFNNVAGFGNCTIEFTDGDAIAAINAPQWQGSAHCGECVLVTGPLGTVRVKIVDQCPECVSGDLDLSPSAFAMIADPIAGRVPISWERVDCPVAGAVDFRHQGSNPFYIKLQVLDHRVGVAGLELRQNGSATFEPLSRVDDNFFERLFPVGLAFPIEARATATTGEQLLHSFPSIVNDTIIPGSSQFASCGQVFEDGFESP